MRPGGRQVLAGDVGGTHARLALFEVAQGRRTPLRETVFDSGEYDGLEPIVLEFLRETGGEASAACLGVAQETRCLFGGCSERTPCLDGFRCERVSGGSICAPSD